MGMMPESVPGPVGGAPPPDQPQGRDLRDIAAEFYNAIFQDRVITDQEMMDIRMLFESIQMTIEALQAGQPAPPNPYVQQGAVDGAMGAGQPGYTDQGAEDYGAGQGEPVGEDQGGGGY